MRLALIPLLLLLSSCGRGDEETDNGTAVGTPAAAAEAVFAGAGRDRLCTKGERAGFITYAESGNSNCAVRGSAAVAGDRLRITPDGDAACVIDAQRSADGFVLGASPPACAYYCGPNASFAGKRFGPTQGASAATDLAGDPLC